MTKDEAIQSLKDGNKLTHRYFADGEWMILKNGLYYFEDNTKVNPDDFCGQFFERIEE